MHTSYGLHNIGFQQIVYYYIYAIVYLYFASIHPIALQQVYTAMPYYQLRDPDGITFAVQYLARSYIKLVSMVQ